MGGDGLGRFVQRRLVARWGFAVGAVSTALLFTGIHLPLSLYGADGIGDVGYNITVMVASGIGMRLLIGAFDSWGHRSILALGLIHATFNASSELVDPDSDWVRYVITLTLGLLAWALWHATRSRASGAAARRDASLVHPEGGTMSVEVLRYAAFTADGRGGNPAGVVLDAGSLTDLQMLAIAQAIGYSETAFLSRFPSSSSMRPRAEPGHRAWSPRCGSSVRSPRWRSVDTRRSPPRSRLRNAEGLERYGCTPRPAWSPSSPATRPGGLLVATLTSPPTTTARSPQRCSRMRSLRSGGTRADLDPRYPVHVAFAGNQHLILGVRTRETLAGLAYDYPGVWRG